MRTFTSLFALLLLTFTASHSTGGPGRLPTVDLETRHQAEVRRVQAGAAVPGERMTADTPKTTTGGNGFIAPAGWTLTMRGPATILEVPEGGSHIALVDVQGTDAPAAVAAAWAAYKPEIPWPLKLENDAPDRDGWSKRRRMELARGALPDGTRYVGEAPLLERRASQVPTGKDSSYGMGLWVDTRYGVPVVHHGGDMIGYHSDMMWLPDHNVGAVVLTNGDPGWLIRGAFRRKLLEVLFDGRPEADEALAAGAKTFADEVAAERKLLTIPAAADLSGGLATRYSHPALGDIVVGRHGAATVFDFGEWKSDVASRRNPDGSVSFLTIAPGLFGFEFVVANGPNRGLILRDAQHEYRFAAEAAR